MTQTSLITFQRRIDVFFFYHKLEKKWVTIAPYTVLSDYLAYILHNKFLKTESQR